MIAIIKVLGIGAALATMVGGGIWLTTAEPLLALGCSGVIAGLTLFRLAREFDVSEEHRVFVDEFRRPYRGNLDEVGTKINVATGLPMKGGIDIQGNPQGVGKSLWE